MTMPKSVAPQQSVGLHANFTGMIFDAYLDTYDNCNIPAS
jgi:hypothetical protein